MFRNFLSSCFQYFIGEPTVRTDDLRILYVSPNFIIVNKHCDVLINSNHPKEKKMTVEKQLKYFFPHLADASLTHSFRFIHRLDYSTSGTMCIALSRQAARSASSAFEMRLSQKYYLALVHGHVTCSAFSVDSAIGTDSRPNFSHCMCTESNDYCLKPKSALTLILLLELGLYNGKPASKIMLKPITGRRHQLRIHCREVNHTIIGDYTYSQRTDVAPYRMFLHAFRLVLPTTLECIDIYSKDPFTQEDSRNLWTPVQIVNQINEDIYSKFPTATMSSRK